MLRWRLCGLELPDQRTLEGMRYETRRESTFFGLSQFGCFIIHPLFIYDLPFIYLTRRYYDETWRTREEKGAT